MFDRDAEPLTELTARIAATLRAPVGLDATFDARVMAQVAALPAHRPTGAASRVWYWLRRPRTLVVSPLAGLATAAGLAAVVFLAGRAAAPHASRAAPVASAATPVEFLLIAPRAASVALVGDFNDWTQTATPLRTVAQGGVWTVTVPLAPGRYRYAFVVDGKRWQPDPSAPPAPDDEFGSPASVVTVGGTL